MKKIILSMALLASLQAHSENLYSYSYSLEDMKGNTLFKGTGSKGAKGLQYTDSIETKSFFVVTCDNNKKTMKGSSLKFGSKGVIDLNKGVVSITEITFDMNGYKAPIDTKKCINSSYPKQIKSIHNIEFDLSKSTEQKFQVNPDRIIKVLVKK